MGVVIQTQKYGRDILYSSSFTIISVISAWYYRLYVNCILTCLVLSSSLLYWSNPVDGWRRKLDIVVVNTGSIYQLTYSSQFIPHWMGFILYLVTFSLGVGCYITACYFGNLKRDYYLASRYHIALHVFGNISNLILYYNLSGVSEK